MLPRNKLAKLSKNKKKSKEQLSEQDAESYTTIMSTHAIIDLLSYELVDYPDQFNKIKNLLINDIKENTNNNEFCKLTRNVPIEQLNKSYNIGIEVVDIGKLLDMSMLPKNNELNKNDTTEQANNVNTDMQAHILKQCSDIMLCVFLTYRKYAIKFKEIGELKNIKNSNGNFVFPQTNETTDQRTGKIEQLPTFETLLLKPGGGLYLYSNSVKKLDVVINVAQL